jgi:hypothetical protein
MKLFWRKWSAPITAVAVMISSATAALTFSPGYGATDYLTLSGADSISSYDWGSDGNLYYGTATPSFNFGGIYRHDGSGTTTIKAANSNYSGASVVAIGSSIYYNDSTPSNVQRIFRYQIGDASTISADSTNYSLGTDGSHLLTTGSDDFTTTRISYYPDGTTGGTIDLGGIDGASGPVAFDASGNLYYAPGFGSLSIYRWSSSEVATAISSNGVDALLAAGHLWLDYSASFGTVSGASSLLLDANGNVIVTLTDFVNPSALVKFDADGSGGYETILTSDERLGDLRMHAGNLYLSDSNRIVAIIPEPSASLISLLALVPCLIRRRR